MSRRSISGSGSSFTRCSSASTPAGSPRACRAARAVGSRLAAGRLRGRHGGGAPAAREGRRRADSLPRAPDPEPAQPIWLEKQFQFKLGPHVLRGRVDRVDRLPDGGYELIDYKTGRPQTLAQLARTSSSRCTPSARARPGSSSPPGRHTSTCSTTKRSACRRDDGERARLDHAPSWRSPTASWLRASSRRRRSRPARCATTDSRALPPSAEPSEAAGPEAAR